MHSTDLELAVPKMFSPEVLTLEITVCLLVICLGFVVAVWGACLGFF